MKRDDISSLAHSKNTEGISAKIKLSQLREK